MNSSAGVIPVHRGGMEASERVGICLRSHSKSLMVRTRLRAPNPQSRPLCPPALSPRRMSQRYFQRSAVLREDRGMVFDLNTTKPHLDMKSRPLCTGDSVLGHFISYFKKDWLKKKGKGLALDWTGWYCRSRDSWKWGWSGEVSGIQWKGPVMPKSTLCQSSVTKNCPTPNAYSVPAGRWQLNLADLHKVTVNWGFKNHIKYSSELVLDVHHPPFLLNSSNLYILDSNLCLGGGDFYYCQLFSDSFFPSKWVPSWPNVKWSSQSTKASVGVCTQIW